MKTLVLALLAAVLDTAACAQPPALEVAAWLPTNWDLENAWASLTANASRITCVSPVWYWLRADGGVTARLPGGKTGAWVGGIESDVRAVSWKSGIKVVPLISNSRPGRGFDADLIGRILNSGKLRAAHVRALTSLVVAHGYDGIEIDYEEMKGRDRAAFVTFMSELAGALHAKGRILAGAFHPKLAEPGDDWGPMAQDWDALGKVVDSFRIMTYDHHWGSGPAGPIAPLPWFKEVLAFAVARVPKGKILMGIPTYGYDWSGTWTGRSADVSPRGAPALAKQKGAKIGWDPVSNEPNFTYFEGTAEHLVWYEDADCLPLKLEAVRAAGIAGIAIWRLGSEEPAFWQRLAQGPGPSR